MRCELVRRPLDRGTIALLLAVSIFAGVHPCSADVNLQGLFFSEKLSEETGPRPELILQLPIPFLSPKDGGRGFYGILYLGGVTLHNNDGVLASSLAIGRVIYAFTDLRGRRFTFVPHIDIARQSGIDFSGDFDDLDRIGVTDALAPGFEASAVIHDDLRAHLLAGLYSYVEPENYHVRAGLSHGLNRRSSLVLVGERYSWDIEEDGIAHAGESNNAILKCMVRFRQNEDGFSYMLSAGVGYEWSEGRGSPDRFSPADLDIDGMVYHMALAMGLSSW